MKEQIQYEPCMFCGSRVIVTYELPDDYPEYMIYIPRDHGLYACKECTESLEQSLKEVKLIEQGELPLKTAREFLQELRENKNN